MYDDGAYSDEHAGSKSRLPYWILIGLMAACCRSARADEPTIERKIGDVTYSLRLQFRDHFDDLDDWLVESTGKLAVEKNWLKWDCFSSGKQAGTVWCKRRFSGPTVVEYDAVAEAGARNLNFIFYATHPQGLLETTNSHTGTYGQYHVFPNYIITYLTPPVEGKPGAFSDTQWRIRFRKNPGFELLTERMVETNRDVARRRRITYVFDAEGRMELYVDGQLLHAFHNKSPYRSGYHGFRTWNSDVRYANFSVYSIHGPRAKGAGKP